MQLRPYQQAVADYAICVLPFRHLLVVLPTGSGKTVIFSHIAKLYASHQKRVSILVHRRELLDQVSRTLTEMEVDHGIVAPQARHEPEKTVQVASVHSLIRRLDRHVEPDLTIVDEAHHCIPDTSWGRILQNWTHAQRLGVTATPQRLSGEGLQGLFDELYCGPGTRELIELGALSQYIVFAPPVHYMAGVHRKMGDYDRKELSDATDRPTVTGDAIAHYQRHAYGKRAIVFCVGIQHARHVADRFILEGLTAACLDGDMVSAERERIVRDFDAGRLTILTSCDLVSEGFDIPSLEAVILLRPTMSLGLYLQQVGRALRPYPGKSHAIILDHAGNTSRHGFPDDEREWSLEGSKREKGEAQSEAVAAIKSCKQCFLAVRTSAMACHYCGYVFPVEGRKIQLVDGELQQVDVDEARKARRASQWSAQSIEALQLLAKTRGYKPGWAMRIMLARKAKLARVRGVR